MELKQKSKKEVDKEKRSVFSTLKSDTKLRLELADLECENPSDSNSVKIMLEYHEFSGNQRIWLKRLLARGGAKYDPKIIPPIIQDNQEKIIDIINKRPEPSPPNPDSPHSERFKYKP